MKRSTVGAIGIATGVGVVLVAALVLLQQRSELLRLRAHRAAICRHTLAELETLAASGHRGDYERVRTVLSVAVTKSCTGETNVGPGPDGCVVSSDVRGCFDGHIRSWLELFRVRQADW